MSTQVFNSLVQINKVSSVEFIRAVFDCYRQQTCFVVSDADASQLSGQLGPIDRRITPQPGGGWVKLDYSNHHSQQAAQIVFSSGTEGAPKAIVISYRSLADVVERLNKLMRVDASIREYVGVPVTYSFGLGRCRAVAAAGGQFYLPEQGFNPLEIRQMLLKGEINAISAVPSLWRILLEQPQLVEDCGAKVRWIEIGSQYMSAEEKSQMKQLFPNARIVQHYGLTEASRTTLLDISHVDASRLESIGKPFDSVEVKLDAQQRICIRGEHVALGRLIDGQLQPLTDEDDWLTTSDQGEVKDGFLYFKGRADDVINCAGVKFSPEWLERELAQRLPQFPVVIAAVKDTMRGHGFLVVCSDANADRSAIQQGLHQLLMASGVNALSSIHVEYRPQDQLPLTETGKVKRKVLASEYESSHQEQRAAKNESRSILELFQRLFPSQPISQQDTFKSLGGDSLNYVKAAVMLENHLGHLPRNWDSLSIKQLQQTDTVSARFFSRLECSIFLRAVAILAVVIRHAGLEIVGGGTMLLFLLVGFNMARFRTESFVSGGAWQMVKTYALNLLIPYYLLTIIYLAWNRSLEFDVILLYANLLSAKITVVFPFWFVQNLLQCLVMVGGLFSLEWFRQKVDHAAWSFSFFTLLLLIAVRAFYPLVWDTSLLNNLVPIRFIAHIWLGWCIFHSDSRLQRLIICLTGICYAYIDTGAKPETFWLIFGSLALPFIRHLLVPKPIKYFLNLVAEATFYIFIFNGLLIYLFEHILNIESILLSTLAGLIGSIAGWWVLEKQRVPVRIFRWLFPKKTTFNATETTTK